MIVRSFDSEDSSEFSRIHKQYENEFSLGELGPEKYVIESDKGNVIVIGANHSLAEVRLVTDKNYPVKMRREALYRGFEVSKFVAKTAGYNQLHAFVQDEVWLKQLIKHGFRPTKGISVVIDI